MVKYWWALARPQPHRSVLARQGGPEVFATPQSALPAASTVRAWHPMSVTATVAGLARHVQHLCAHQGVQTVLAVRQECVRAARAGLAPLVRRQFAHRHV